MDNSLKKKIHIFIQNNIKQLKKYLIINHRDYIRDDFISFPFQQIS